LSVALLPVIASLFPEQTGWRVFFAIGILPAGLILFIRRLVPDSVHTPRPRRRATAE
jgi:MFS family permease